MTRELPNLRNCSVAARPADLNRFGGAGPIGNGAGGESPPTGSVRRA
jgi:hypothetical protein